MTSSSNQATTPQIDLESEDSKKLLEDYVPATGFDKIGYARPLGGFFYEFFFALIGGVLVLITFSQILRVLYPYPDAKGYTTVGNVLFSFIFFALNIPTGFSIERFIAEWRVKNPDKMVQYMRFYIWYQMISGLFLVSGTSIFVLYILETGTFVYTKWLMLIYIAREYPAMFDVFQAGLKGLQQFQYETRVRFFGQILLEPGFEIGFVLWGRFVLGADPAIGEIMGIAIGYAIGTYVDDIFKMFLSMHYFKRTLNQMGYTIKDVFIPKVDKDVWLTSLKFGLALAPPGLISTSLGLITFYWWYNSVPAYATLIVLNETADKLANLIKRGGGVYLKPTVSESLNNGKKELTHYYIGMTFKMTFISMIGVGLLIYSFMPILLDVMFKEVGIESWLLAISFITPNIIATTVEQPIATSNDVILGGNKPLFHSFMNIARLVLLVIFDYIFLFVLKIPQNMGLGFLIWYIPIRALPIDILILIGNWAYISKTLVKIRWKEFAWQTWVAPFPAGIGMFILAQIYFLFIYGPLKSATGIYVSSGITIVIAFLLLLWVFFPLYTFFGGWDKHNIEIFHEAVEISGPSKFLFKPIDYANRLLVKSPLHSRFPIPYEKANEEAIELMKIRHIKQKLVAQSMKKT